MTNTHVSCSCQNVLRPAALLRAVEIDHAPYSMADMRTTRPPYCRVLLEHMYGV
jgi:hypothetical protein